MEQTQQHKISLQVYCISDNGEKTHILAATIVAALKIYLDETCTSIGDLGDETEISIVPKDKYTGFIMSNPDFEPDEPIDEDNWQVKNLEEYLKEERNNYPHWVCSTLM